MLSYFFVYCLHQGAHTMPYKTILLLISFLLFITMMKAQNLTQVKTPAGTKITNQAIAIYTFMDQEYTTESNLVITEILPVYDVSVSPDGTTARPGQVFYGLAGSEIVIPYTLLNTSNAIDSYNLSVSIDVTSTFNPAKLRIARDNNQNGLFDPGEPIVSSTSIDNVPPGDYRGLLLILEIPPSVLNNKYAFLNIIAQSKNDTTVADANNISKVEVLQGPIVQINMDVDFAQIAPTGILTYNVQGKNVGMDPAMPTHIILDGASQNGFLVSAKVPESNIQGTTLLSASPLANPGSVIYSIDGGATWLSNIPNEPITHIALFYKSELAVEQNFRLQFQVAVASSHPPGTIFNQATAFFRNKIGYDLQTTSNEVQTTVQAAAIDRHGYEIYVGPYKFPLQELEGDYNADIQTLDAVHTGNAYYVKMSVINKSTSDEVVNLYLEETLPATWAYRFLQSDGITPLLDTDNNGQVDLGVVKSEETQDFILWIDIPASFDPSSLPGRKANIPVMVSIGSDVNIKNRTWIEMRNVLSINAIWQIQKTNSPSFEVDQGGTITYSLIFANIGTSAANNVILMDEISDSLQSLTYTSPLTIANENGAGSVTATANYDPVSRILQWQIAEPVNPNFKGRIPFSATIKADVAEDTEIRNQFSLVSSLNTEAYISASVSNIVIKPILQITKSVNKSIASIGDMLVYTISVSNTSQTIALHDASVVDTLPDGFSYKNDTTLLNGTKGILEPTISPNGRTLTFSIGALPINTTSKIQFLVQIGPRTKIAEHKNLAQAHAFTPANAKQSSFVVHAATTISGGVFAERGWIFGRVYVDLNENNEYDCETEPAIPSARIYMENGQYAITDGEGKYSIEDLRLGTHVVCLDKVTLPPKMKIRDTGRHSAYNGKTQFVDLKIPGPWRSDFAVALEKDAYLPCQAKITAAIEAQEGEALFQSSPLSKSFSTVFLLPNKTDETWNEDVSSIDKLTLNYALDGLPKQGKLKLNITIHKPEDQKAQETVANKVLEIGKFLTQRFGFTQERLHIAWEDGKSLALPFVPVEKKKKTKGIVSPEDGEVFMLQNTIKVKIVGSIQNQLALGINGEEVPERQIGTRTFNVKEEQTVLEYVGVPLKPGKNLVQLKAITPRGDVEEESIVVYKAKPPKNIKTAILPAQIAADGKTEPIVLIELLDEDGKLATSGLFLTVSCEGSNIITPDANPQQMGHQLRVEDGRAKCSLSSSIEAKEAKLTIEINDLVSHVPILYKPYLRDWIIVGLGEGTLGFDNVKGGDEDEGLYVNGRLAFFLRGNILGEALLTAQYDSKLPREESNTLLKKVDPDKYYPVYGDSSLQGFEVQSTTRFYVKLERDQNYIMYGDYSTEMEGMLTAYHRTFQGIKGEIKTEYLDVKLFGTKAQQVIVKDEIRGRGISGYYFLSQGTLIENTLHIVIETRDRFQPDIILHAIPKQLYVDYDADFSRGWILFDTPIASADEDGNPIFIVATYESKEAASKEYIGGIRATAKFFEDKVQVGGTYVYEGQQKGDTKMAGLHAEVRPAEGLSIRGEIAKTRTFDMAQDQTKKGEGYVVEAKYENEEVKAWAGYHKVSQDYHNPSMSGLETGTEKIFGKAEVKATENLKVQTEVYQMKAGEDRQIVAEARSILKTGDITTFLGYKFVDQRTEEDDAQLHILSIGVRWDVTDYLAFKAERRQVLPYDSNVHPIRQADRTSIFTRVGSNIDEDFSINNTTSRINILGDRIISTTSLGVEVTPIEWLKFWVSEEFQDNKLDVDYSRTLFGVNLQLTKHISAYTSYGIENALSNSRSQALMGVRSSVPILNWLTGDVFVEKVETVDGDDSADFLAYGMGLQLSRINEKGSLRVEFRHAKEELTIMITPALAWKMDENITSFWRTRHFQNRDSDNFLHNTLLGFAYRPACSDKVNIIAKTQFEWERNMVDLPTKEELIWTNSLDLHTRLIQDVDIMVRYASKYAEMKYSGVKGHSFTDLFAGRILYELHNQVDVGIHGGILHEYGTDQFSYSYGVEAGYKVVKNLWLSAGYNFKGLKDKDMVGNDFLRQGFYITLRFKFDEDTAEDLLPPW